MKLFDKWFKKTTKDIVVKEKAEVPVKNSSSSINILNSTGYWSSSSDSDEYFETSYIVNRGIEMLSDMLANIPLKLFKGDKELPTDFIFPNGFNPNKPHPHMSLKELFYKAYVHYFYNGEFMIRITEDPFLYLDIVNPDEMKPISTTAWRYQSNVIIPVDSLIYLPMYNPCEVNTNTIPRGLSPIEVVKEELKNDQSALEYITACFENGSAPGITLKTTSDSTAEDRERMKAQFESRNQGSKRAGNVVVLGKDVGIEFPKTKPNDMQYLEARVANRDRVLSAMGIPKILFNGMEGINRAVSEETHRMLWSTNLRPKSIKVVEKYNQQFFSKHFPGYRQEPDFSGIKELQENMESVLKQAMEYRLLGYSLNEINEHFNLGMEPVTDSVGDMRFIPSNLMPADDLLMEEVAPPAKKESNSITVKELDNYFNPKKVELKSDGTYTRNIKKISSRVEKNIFKDLVPYFSKQLGSIVSIVKKNYKQPKTENKITLSETNINALILKIYNKLEKDKQLVKGLFTPILEEGSLSASGFALTTIKDTTEATVNNRIVGQMVNKVTKINNTTYKMLKREITTGVKAGESLAKMTKRMSHVFKFSKSRARTIAATESANIINRTTHATYKDKGVKKKRWLTVGDSNVRDAHVSNAAQGAIPFNKAFSSGQQYPSDPAGGAGLCVNCRCTLSPVIR